MAPAFNFTASDIYGMHLLCGYDTVIRACIESAFVTWIGLLLYEICSLAPNGHVVVWEFLCEATSYTHEPFFQTNYDVGYVMACVIPDFFVSISLVVGSQLRAYLAANYTGYLPMSYCRSRRVVQRNCRAIRQHVEVWSRMGCHAI